MKNFVIINGVNSNTINGLGINELPPISKPSMRVMQEEIDGRDGDITTNLGYSAYDKTITIGLFGTGYDINDIISFFNGEGTITFSNEDDKYYKYKIINQIDYEALQKFKQASITFHCQPFKYPLTETPLEIEYSYIEQEGENLTLSNTGEATLKVDLLGNTEQTQYTGINLFSADAPSKTQVGITVTNNGDGTFSISGTATANLSIPLTTTLGQPLTGGQPYTMAMEILSNGGSGGSLAVEISKNGTPQYNFFAISPQTTTGMKTQVSTPSEDATIRGITYYCGSGAVVNNLKIRPYLVKGSYTSSTIPPFEPYVGGTASPNPSFPSPINVVSGDNIIISTGKNLLDDITWVEGKYISSNNEELTNTGWKHSDYIDISKGDYIYEVGGTSGNAPKTIVYNGNKSVIQVLDVVANAIYDLSQYNATYIRVSSPIVGTPKVCQKEEYQVNLGVENLFDENTTLTSSDFTYSNGYYTGLASTLRSYMNDNRGIINFKENTQYTISLTGYLGTATNVRVRFIYTDLEWTETTYLTGSTPTQISGTSTAGKTISYIILNYSIAGTIYIKDFQVEEGTKVNSFTPYGTTPIELNKIGDYQDRFIRNKGIQLWDELIEYGGYSVSTGQKVNTNYYRSINYIPISANTELCFMKPIGKYTRIYFYDSSKVFISAPDVIYTNRLVSTFTTPENAKYMTFQIDYGSATYNNDIMIYEGTTALPYEPYGNGDWYLEKKIGKEIVDFSRTVDVSVGSITLKGLYGLPQNKKETGGNGVFYERAKYVLVGNRGENTIYENPQNVVIVGSSTDTLETLQAKFNGGLLYYILSSPTYTPITGTLKDELEAVWRANSYKGTTNIGQVNNDKAFIISAKALEQGSNEVVVNNIGNAYSKPLIALEGSGNVDIYLDNTQILKANLEDKMNIDINSLEAYNPDTSALLNRQVMGNYNSMTMPSGESTIRIDGALEKATITNYVRWL